MAASSAGLLTTTLVRAHVIVQASLGVGRAILAEAGLSYLGLGTQPPVASWGKMLQEAQGFMGQAPWMAIGIFRLRRSRGP